MVENLKIAKKNSQSVEKEVPIIAGTTPPGDAPQSVEPATGRFKQRILKGIYFHFYRLHAILFLFSVCVSVLSQVFSTYLPVVQEFAAGFLIFWMPGFCVMFLLWDSTAFKPIYLLPLTLAFSQVVIITEGLVCALLGFLWTPLAVLCTTTGFAGASFYIAWQFKGFRLGQPLRLKKCENFEKFREQFYGGKIIPKNFGYLFGFLILLGIYAVVAFPLLPDDDPWFHARLVRTILDTGVIPFSSFRGSAGLHIYSSAFGLIAGWDAITIARWFPVFLVLNGNLAFYLIIRRLLKDPQIANLGTLLISFTPILFFYGVNNFWANALALPFGLYLLFFLFDANLRKKVASRSQKWIYISIGLYFAFILRVMHAEVFISYWLSALAMQVFYRKTTRAQTGNLMVIILAFGIKSAWDIFYPPEFSFENFLSGISPIFLVLLIPGAIVGYIVLKKLSTFPPGNFEQFTAGKVPDAKIIYTFEKRYLKFLMVGVGVLALPFTLTTFYYVSDLLWMITLVGTTIVLFLEFIAPILGAFIFRRQERWGKIIVFWGGFFIVSLIGYSIYDLLYAHTYLTVRMLVFASPGLMLVAMAYVGYALHSRNLNPKKVRRFLGIFAISSLVITMTNFPLGLQSMSYAGASGAEDVGLSMTYNSVVITGFNWKHPIFYFSYQRHIVVYDDLANSLFPVDGQLNRTFLYNLREKIPSKQVYLILDSSYLHFAVDTVAGPTFDVLSLDQVRYYENFTYLNRVQGFWTGDGNWMMTFCLV